MCLFRLGIPTHVKSYFNLLKIFIIDILRKRYIIINDHDVSRQTFRGIET